jgi:hypothetical protein
VHRLIYVTACPIDKAVPKGLAGKYCYTYCFCVLTIIQAFSCVFCALQVWCKLLIPEGVGGEYKLQLFILGKSHLMKGFTGLSTYGIILIIDLLTYNS